VLFQTLPLFDDFWGLFQLLLPFLDPVSGKRWQISPKIQLLTVLNANTKFFICHSIQTCLVIAISTSDSLSDVWLCISFYCIVLYRMVVVSLNSIHTWSAVHLNWVTLIAHSLSCTHYSQISGRCFVNSARQKCDYCRQRYRNCVCCAHWRNWLPLSLPSGRTACCPVRRWHNWLLDFKNFTSCRNDHHYLYDHFTAIT